jgi:hypothetical protein
VKPGEGLQGFGSEHSTLVEQRFSFAHQPPNKSISYTVEPRALGAQQQFSLALSFSMSL